MNATQEPRLDHEKLEAYRKAVSFVAWLRDSYSCSYSSS